MNAPTSTPCRARRATVADAHCLRTVLVTAGVTTPVAVQATVFALRVDRPPAPPGGDHADRPSITWRPVT
ncbi:hypothetical protein ACH4MA_01265 [Streptomyces roseolus]|uniref:hypothetical protein n=1 Tax=Streptomyces roseolus TaxID=67358 RepID=UPI0037B733C7